LRVTHLASGDLWAGAESQLYNLVLALRANPAVDPDVVLLNEGLLAQRLRDADIRVTILDERRLGAMAIVRALRAHVAHRLTQVLHTHRYKENVLGSAVRLTQPGLHSMRTVHGAPESDARTLDLHRRAQRRLDWFCARFVQSPVVCVSHPLAELCRETLPASRLRVVANGVDVDGLSGLANAPVSLPGDTSRYRIGFFGRLTGVKRVDIVIDTARCLEDRAPGTYGVFIFGEGPLRPALEELVRQRRLEQCVHFMGFASEPAAYLRNMDALLLTSDHEGLPMVVLEAMALRVHVVSRAVGAIPEVLDGGRVGSLVTGADPSNFADVIAARHAATRETSDMTAAAYERVADRYSATRTASEYLEIYAGLAEG
jgi:glycosyltransferase involved in cell wall biosynthesis